MSEPSLTSATFITMGMAVAGFHVRHHLLILLHLSLGVDKNDENALILWNAAAQKGNALSQMHLGLCYLRGSCGLTKSAKEAKRFVSYSLALFDNFRSCFLFE